MLGREDERRHALQRFVHTRLLRGPCGYPILVSIGGVIYLVLGVLVAVSQNYFDSLTTLGRLLSAILAVMLWPLLLLGIDIRIG